MMKNTPSGAKKHCESTEPESHQTAKNVFLSSSQNNSSRSTMEPTFSQEGCNWLYASSY